MDNHTVTVTLLSKMLDISPRQIQLYVSQGVLPKPRVKGHYDWAGCIGALLDHKLIGPGSPGAKACPPVAEYAMEKISYMREEIIALQDQIAELEAMLSL